MFALLLVCFFLILTVGGYMKNNRKVFFDSACSPIETGEVYACLIEAVRTEAIACGFDTLVTKCNRAVEFIRDPNLALFTEIVSPLPCRDENDFYLDSQLIAFFKKRNDLNLGIDKAEAAYALFVQSESHCRDFNKKLRNVDDPHYAERATLLYKMSRKISTCLGALPDLCELDYGFGPGANVGVKSKTSVRWKLNAHLTTTVGALQLAAESRLSTHAWPGTDRTVLVSGSYFTTVPKTSTIDRGINVEPLLNSYIQKGIGSVIRQRLRNVNVDLSDQSVNQRMAKKGSLDGSLATIDLSMASDTISYLLVLDLLPADWFRVLDLARSPVVVRHGKRDEYHVLEKFSSMGNGATFELESLIFWSLLSVVCDGSDEISVYGDDLICPVEYYDRVLHALSLCGFIPNSSKSFGSGPFRESCGKDYWAGTDVRPVYIKDKMSVKELFRLHNFFVRTGRLCALPTRLLRFIPREMHHFGPDGLGDGHLVWDSSAKPTRDKRGWEPFWKFRTFVTKPEVDKTPLESDYGSFLYNCEKSLSLNPNIPGFWNSGLHMKDYSPICSDDSIYNLRSSRNRYRLVTIRTPWR